MPEMYRSRPNMEKGAGLSSLAKGRGFHRRGVEVECFIDDFKAYTLAGQPFLQSSASGTGGTAKPYRSHTLTLPKTYVTKRGQMVLFTAPEDMILGQSCAMHPKELPVTTSKSTSSAVLRPELKTTDLAITAMSYVKNDASAGGLLQSNSPGLEEGRWAGQGMKGAWQDQREVKAGHFPDVYLRSLQRATTTTTTAAAKGDCRVEDLEAQDLSKKNFGEEVQMDVETQMVQECDSGLGQSIGPSPSGRFSSQSQRSESSTVISIPHGRLSSDEVCPPHPEGASPEGGKEGLEGSTSQAQDDGGLAALKQELALYKAKGIADSKKSSKTGKKRQRPKSTSSRAGDTEPPPNIDASKSKTKKSSKGSSGGGGGKSSAVDLSSSSKLDPLRSGHAKGAKVKKRRGTKKASHVQEGEGADPMVVEGAEGEELRTAVQDRVTQVQGHVTVNGHGLGQKGAQLEVTTVPLGVGVGEESALHSMSRRSSRAEERKAEIERKRQEKRELEHLRKVEEEERLKAELEASNAIQEFDSSRLEVEDTMIDSPRSPPSPEPLPPSPPPLSTTQQHLLEALERAKLRENRLLLSLKVESSNQMMGEEMRAVEEAVERARRAAEVLERKREEEERRRREEEELRQAEEERKRLDEEAVQAAFAQRAMSIGTKSALLKEECVRAVEMERTAKRYNGTVAQSILFSYFSYVPPRPLQRDKNAKTRGKRPQTIRSK